MKHSRFLYPHIPQQAKYETKSHKVLNTYPKGCYQANISAVLFPLDKPVLTVYTVYIQKTERQVLL